jgi:hypothetical protein
MLGVERLHAAATVEIEAMKGTVPLAIFSFLPFINNICIFYLTFMTVD